MTRIHRDLNLASAFLAEAKSRAMQESKKRNLDLLWSALEETRHEGRRKYGISDVGAKLAKLGGVRAQSIRNDAGEDYRRLIQLFAEADSALAIDASPIEKALSLIPDESVRASVKASLAEAKRLKVENDRLRSICGELALPLHAGAASVVSPSASTSLGLTPRLRNALQKGMLPDRLKERDLSVEEDGSVKQRGLTLFPPGFASAIALVLAQSDTQSTEAKRLP